MGLNIYSYNNSFPCVHTGELKLQVKLLNSLVKPLSSNSKVIMANLLGDRNFRIFYGICTELDLETGHLQ